MIAYINRLTGLLVGVVSLLMAASLWAANRTATQTVSIVVTQLLDLGISPTTISFGTITGADFTAAGKTLIANNTLTIKSNGPKSPAWSVAIVANAANWTGPWSKPASALQVKKNTDSAGWTTSAPFSTTLTGLSTTSATYATGTRGVMTSSQDYKVLLDLTTDVPGSYSLSLTYTASTL